MTNDNKPSAGGPVWIPTVAQLPEDSVEVIGYHPDWIDEDFNPRGIRICFHNDGERWHSARWYDHQDTYINGDERHFGDNPECSLAPDLWMQIPEIPSIAPANKPSADDALLSLPADGAYIIRFDDTDNPDIFFAMTGARDAAFRRYEELSGSWNAHLYVKIDSNCRDVKCPSAAFVKPSAALVLEVPKQLVDQWLQESIMEAPSAGHTTLGAAWDYASVKIAEKAIAWDRQQRATPVMVDAGFEELLDAVLLEAHRCPGSVSEQCAVEELRIYIALRQPKPEAVGFRHRIKGRDTAWQYNFHRSPDSFELRECEIETVFAGKRLIPAESQVAVDDGVVVPRDALQAMIALWLDGCDELPPIGSPLRILQFAISGAGK